jgi:hypothetical protein
LEKGHGAGKDELGGMKDEKVRDEGFGKNKPLESGVT